MYEMTNEISFTKTGKDQCLKLHEAAAMMMDCCQFQEYQEKEFCDFLRSNQIAIFLFSIQLDILRFPKFRETVKTAVKIYGCKSIYGLRRITMRDASGKLCLISNATGAFFDLKAGKALKLDPNALPLKFDEAEPMECLPRKIPVPAANGIEAEPFKVCVSHLDPNGHLTSPIYFSMAQDILPEDFRFNRIRIEFKKQTLPNEVLYPVRFEAENNVQIADLRDKDGISHAAVEFSTFDSLSLQNE